jgi:hypothetical protein
MFSAPQETDTPVPTEPATTEPTPQPEGQTYQHGMVRFNVPEGITDNFNCVDVPQSEPEDGMFGEGYVEFPDHVLCEPVNYAVSEHFHTPRVYFFRAQDYLEVNEFAAGQIEALETLLSVYPAGETSLPDQLPFTPIFNAAQVYTTRRLVLSFQNGTGIRYLTQYAQAPVLPTNSDMFYTFQGLSEDGETYIVALLPVNHPELPDSYDEIDWVEMEENYEEQLAEAVAKVSEYSDDSFTPSLADLDAWMRSIRTAGE